MSKEYLDRKEVDNILTDIWDDEIVPLWEGIITATEEIRIQKSLDKLVNQICQLKPKNYISNKELKELKKYGSLMQKELIKLRKEKFERKNQKVIAGGEVEKVCGLLFIGEEHINDIGDKLYKRRGKKVKIILEEE